ncbi:MAG: trigger factor [Gemmatimonadales bacterium]
MSPSIRITKVREDPGETSLKVEIPTELVKAAETRAVSRYAKKAKLPGFRKGKVPLQVIKKKFQERIREATLQDLIGDSWKAALAQEDFKPLTDPRVKDLKFEAESPVTFELLVEVKPKLKLNRVAGFKVTRKLAKITDTMVAEQLESLRQQKAPWTPLESEKPVAGDLVQATLRVREEGSDDYPEGKPVQFVLGSGQAIPDVEDRIKSMMPSENRDTTVKFPDDFADETKRSQSRAVRIELHEVKRQNLPELTDDFAGEVGDFDTLEDLKRAIRQDLEAAANREADAAVRKELMTQIVSANNVGAPAPLVRRMLGAFAGAYEIAEDQFENFAKEFLPLAEEQVKRDLVLDHLEEHEKLTATEAEIDEKIEEIARSRDTEPGKIYRSLQKANRLKELERGITERKIFEHLISNNTVINE